MKQLPINPSNSLKHLLQLSEFVDQIDLPDSVEKYLDQQSERFDAIKDLDRKFEKLHMFVFSLGCCIKQRYVFSSPKESPNTNDFLYTKQEVALKYRVSLRTINNWIISGLKTIEIGGVIRIEERAISEFSKKNTGKKFNWRAKKSK